MPDYDSSPTVINGEVISPASEYISHIPRRRPYLIHLLLLLLTFFTTLVVGSRLQWNFMLGLPPFDMNVGGYFPLLWALHGNHLLLGLPFSLALMLILLAHELGHYLYCVKYRVAATLPFFIPFPTLIGTLGAFIRIRSSLRSRKILFDIGIAGPIAGFVVTTAVLFLSLARSHVAPLGAQPADIELGYPLIFSLAQKILAATGSAGAIGVVPLTRLYLHPVAIAAWVGMLATSLNLLPGGQLDGGHIVFAVAPRAHKNVSRLTIAALIPLGIFAWTGWLIWAVLLRIVAMRHPPVPEWPDISPGRRILAVFALAMLVLTFMPMPIAQTPLIDILRQLFEYLRHVRH
jgi:membrane-associated protease RseP (regulator of RpoE activity)